MDENRQKLIELLQKKHSVYKDFFDTVNGQEVLKDLDGKYYSEKSTVNTTNIIDPYVLAFREGQRTVLLYIKNMANDKQIKQLSPEQEGA